MAARQNAVYYEALGGMAYTPVGTSVTDRAGASVEPGVFDGTGIDRDAMLLEARRYDELADAFISVDGHDWYEQNVSFVNQFILNFGLGLMDFDLLGGISIAARLTGAAPDLARAASVASRFADRTRVEGPMPKYVPRHTSPKVPLPYRRDSDKVVAGLSKIKLICRSPIRAISRPPGQTLVGDHQLVVVDSP